MNRTFSSDMQHHVGDRIRLAGWVHRRRQLRNVTFLILRDARGLAQIVVTDAEAMDRITRISEESVVEVIGTVRASDVAPGGVELHEPEITVLVATTTPPPIDLHRPVLTAQLPTLLDHAAVTLRHPKRRALARLAAASTEGFRASLRGLGFVEIHTPKLVAAATESGATVFPVEYFGRSAYLAQSPQFFKQIMVGVFERVFEVGPVFRAEPHDTARHVNEYVSLDAELGFIADHYDVMEVLTKAVTGMVEAIEAEALPDARLAGIDVPAVPERVPDIPFSDALAMLSAATGEDLSTEPDLAPAHERWLGRWARDNHGSDFLYVTGFPMSKRPFYTHPDPNRPEFSNSFDLLFRGKELVTGGQRLHRHDDYVTALATRGLDLAPFAGLLEAYDHGMPPHGGFGMGLERWLLQLSGAANIREVTLFPRDINRLTP